MSKVSCYSLVLIFFVALIRENIAVRQRNTFQTSLNVCNVRCRAFAGPPLPNRRNEVKKCLVLPEHKSATVGLCVGGCLENMREELGKVIICDCRNGECIYQSTTTTSTTPAPTSTTSPAPVTEPSTSTTSEPSTSTTSTTSTTTTSESPTSSTTTTSTSPDTVSTTTTTTTTQAPTQPSSTTTTSSSSPLD